MASGTCVARSTSRRTAYSKRLSTRLATLVKKTSVGCDSLSSTARCSTPPRSEWGARKKRYDVSNAHASTHREITGCFIITEFDSSEAIQHLRIFGAPTAAELSNGLEAFGMFDIDDAAAKMLSKQHATEEDSSSPKSGIEGV
mmetsp:Transcript_30580/g.41419  ORF Transcript_30580/g.41419 Transcript_30580/m.41419 type:complete len:143 (+) Transcript_30580:1652-2080(+)